MGKGGSKAANGKDSKLPAKNTKMSKKDLEALSKQTGLSVAQINDVFAKFSNNNPDGILNKDEFARLYQQLRSEPVTNLDEIQYCIFRAFDKDNNGSLTFNEFLVGFVLTSKGDQKQKLDYAFELYDADNNGWLSVNEVKEVLNCMLDLLGADESMCGALAAQIADELDKSNDDKISKDEFINGLSRNYNFRVLMQPFN